jgi:hypothetical protein
MGKPRRCSSAFFAEERNELARKRQKIRMLQQRKQLLDYSSFKDLPDQIPLQLTIGARVTARYARVFFYVKWRNAVLTVHWNVQFHGKYL